MIATTNWGFWGVVVAIVAIVVGAAVAIGIYLRSKAKRVAVSATFDQTGLVQVLIKKTGIPTVHVVAIQPEMGVGSGCPASR